MDNIDIKEVIIKKQKQQITRLILESLKEWFEVDRSREKYIRESGDLVYFVAYSDDKPVGFLCLKETGNATMELHVMGILKEYQRNGIGQKLFIKAKQRAFEMGYSFIQVKTVKMGVYDDYDKTNKFYISLGFKEFEVFPKLWDKYNPCQIYVMSIK